MQRITFIGPGRLGLALGHALALSDPDVLLDYHGRRASPPGHPLFSEGRAGYRTGLEPPGVPGTTVLLTVSDRAVQEVAEELASTGEPQAGCVVLHCSGALDTEVLEPLHLRGYSVGTLHPLESVANPVARADRFHGSYFAVSGEPEALLAARRLARQVGGHPITVPSGGRPLYHAAAVMVSNYLVTVLETGARLFERAGASHEEAEAALVALASGTLDNVRALGTERALTGPLKRGDSETLELHLRALEPEEAELYAALGRRTLALLGEKLDPSLSERLDALFLRYT